MRAIIQFPYGLMGFYFNPIFNLSLSGWFRDGAVSVTCCYKICQLYWPLFAFLYITHNVYTYTQIGSYVHLYMLIIESSYIIIYDEDGMTRSYSNVFLFHVYRADCYTAETDWASAASALRTIITRVTLWLDLCNFTAKHSLYTRSRFCFCGNFYFALIREESRALFMLFRIH